MTDTPNARSTRRRQSGRPNRSRSTAATQPSGVDPSTVDDGPNHLATSSPAVPDVLTHPDVNTGMLRYDDIPQELAEAIRTIVNRYELRHDQKLPSTIAVTSALHGEGVTTVSQALSTLIAQETGQYVCWVDCSWLAPDHSAGSTNGRPGLMDILADRANILSAFQSSPELPQLMSLSAGPVPESKRNMIARSPEFDRLLDVLTSEFDHIVFDIPPVLSNANGLALVRRSDASLLVVRHRTTSVRQFRRALDATQPTPNLGVLLNKFRTSIPRRLRALLGE